MAADRLDTPPPSADAPASGTGSAHERPGAPQRDEGTPAADAADSPADLKPPDLPAMASARDEGHSLTSETRPPAASEVTHGDQVGRAFTVQTPWPRPEGEPQPAPLEFKDLGRAGDLLPEDQRAVDPHPLPMAFLHRDPDVAVRAEAPEPKDPAAAAQADQGHQNYPGVDVDWHNREPLAEGTYLVQTTRLVDGEPQDSRSPYFTGLETLRQSGGDAYDYNTLTQVGAYRGEYLDVAVYRLRQPVDGVAEGTTSQNTQFGVGGGDQFYLRGTDGDHALNPRDNPEYFERVPYGEVKDKLGFEGAGIPDDSEYIPMSHKSSPVDLRGLEPPDFPDA